MSGARAVVIVLPLPPRECHQNRSGRTTGWRETARVVREAREFACAPQFHEYRRRRAVLWKAARKVLAATDDGGGA
jgi:hypothetical protein